MPFLVSISFVAFVLAYLGVGGFRAWAENRQILDLPNVRSSHASPTPRGGGLVIVVLTLAGIWSVHQMRPQPHWVALLSYTLGAVIIANVSWLDDLRALPNWVKFSAHSLGAIYAIVGIGFVQSIDLPLFGSLHLGWGGAVVTFLWIVGLTNAYNFMDGIDGIAGGQAVIAGLGWGIIGWLTGQPVVGNLGLLVAFASLGFLGHNWPPGRIFMGDVGSSFLGYTFAVLPLLLTLHAKDVDSGRALLLGALFLWPFIFDTSFTLLRRLAKGENVMAAHRSHLYQRLVISGFDQRSVTVLYIALAVVGLIAGEVWAPNAIRGGLAGAITIPLLCVALWVFVADSERRRTMPKPAPHLQGLLFRKVTIILSNLCLLSLTYYVSFLLRLDLRLDPPYRRVFLLTLPLILLIKLPVFFYFRLFRGWWRYVGMSDLLDIIKAATVCAPVVYAGIYWSHGFTYYPRTVFLIDPILTIFVVGGVRFAVRAYSESARLHLVRANTLIVGAGRSGSLIARELKGNQKLDYNPVGFVDDDPTKKGIRILGIKVLGSTDELPRLIAKHEVAHILIAIPSASGKQIQNIINKCRACKVDFKTLPAMGDIISGTAPLGKIRSVQLEDLLHREPVKLNLAQIQAKLNSNCVLITGAGGSIGSELARQVAEFNPGKLILYDRSENDLFKIELEIAEAFPKLQCLPVVGDILDVNRLREIFHAHRPNSVFHAAAFKHVPMMEKNCFQAVTNNIFGTYNVALMAKQCRVEDFVMISSDKAVNPSNIMGATKRVAELLILGLQNDATRFVSVRFGNVLGSSGSVIPLFQRQITNRKAITVTHPDATRYFMTIPEAVHLVLQASTMGSGGEIFVLDMGEPVKIVDLAQSLIRLSGFEPEKDIPIVYTGLRPGEKLFEELQLEGEGMKPTTHEKIRVLDGGKVSFDRIEKWLDELAAIVDSKNVNALVNKFKEIVPEYTPSPEIIALSQIDRFNRFVPFSRVRASQFRE